MMQEIQKVIRIPMNTEHYETAVILNLLNDKTEYWFDKDTIFETDRGRNFVAEYTPDIFKQLIKGEADYLAIYSDK